MSRRSSGSPGVTSNDAGRFKSAYRPGGRAIKIVIREKFGIQDAEPEWYQMRATHCLDEFGDQVADGNRCGTRWRGNRGGLAHSPRRDTAHVVAVMWVTSQFRLYYPPFS
jgi:hypothetical protein